MKINNLFSLLFTISSVQICLAQATELPLLQINKLKYEGAFTIPGNEYGDSNANYASGTLAFNSANNSLFLAGFNLHGAVAEFSIPILVNSTNLNDLNSASILQNFRSILNATPDSNPQNIDRISGLYLFNNKLIVNALEYYDAAANNSHTTLIVDNASAIETSAITGYFSLNGEAHASGWISEIPTEWQTLLGGSHITGNSSKYPINSRLAMGISAFSFNVTDLINASTTNISTTTLLNFDLSNPLYADFNTYYNANYNVLELNGTTFSGHTSADADIVVGTNNLWTEQSQASYGFIVPNTRTYITIGSSSGHNSGIGYKAKQNNGNVCGGPCAYDAEDNYNYYWLWDVNDLLAVKNGTSEAYSVRPYAYGEFSVPFQYDAYSSTPEHHEIVGGTYDADSNLLYLSIYDGASTGAYDVIPVIVAYSIDQESLSVDELEMNTSIKLIPNPAKNTFSFTITSGKFEELIIYNNLGQRVNSSTSQQIDITMLNSGVYVVKFKFEGGNIISKRLVVE
ncbi:putative secreted protein (Por secretion system target) [Mariniflexile fucanivorans]|uniref:Putative secreted protein (Por secretion system target) n=1 Tax=Mariniflexile fucanivorans TaxID=264023 RepID=A0A4V2QDS2_9FLAO|nr:T9SS type A sorting domain-containing protein [Mariniflexile fucanivorans]TCL64887.1 putative secreted protein (Por secretion system target) [Mariniflexile fucanivorans]